MNSKKTNGIAMVLGNAFKNKNYLQSAVINRFSYLLSIITLLSMQSIDAQTTCHTFECPEDITISLKDPASCDTTLTIVDLPSPTFVAGMPTTSDFVDEFDPANWTVSNSVALGPVLFTGTTQLNLEGSEDNAQVDIDSWTQICVDIPCDGLISFDWDAEMLNNAGNPCGRFINDEPSYVINGIPTLLTDVNDQTDLDNSDVVCAAADDQFCFRLNSNNNSCTAVFEITAFEFEPHNTLVATKMVSSDLINGGFETTDYTGWDVMDIPVPFIPASVECAPIDIGFDVISALEGSCFAYNGFDGGGPGVISTCQTLTISSTASTFNWSDFISYNLIGEGASIDRMLMVTIDGLSLYDFTAIAQTLEMGTGWVNHSVDISAFRGQTVEICFVEDIPENFTGPAQIGIDAISIEDNIYTPGDYEIQYQACYDGGCTEMCSYNLKVEAYNPGGLTCKTINLSLDNIDCEAELTPAMVITNDEPGCFDNYVIYAITEYGDTVTTLTGDHVNQDLIYNVCIPSLNLCCWNNFTVEDKLPPVLTCMDVDVACNDIASAPDPIITSNNCGNEEIFMTDEDINELPCDPLYTTIITRKWKAKDASDNYSNECIQTIRVLRVNFAGLTAPTNYVGAAALECNSYATDENGNPAPVTVTDVPTIGGIAIWPVTPDFLCNTSIRYVDNVQYNTKCKQTIIRTWELREWHCSGENFISIPQTIQVEDTTGPEFEAPDDMTIGVNNNCKGVVFLPSVDATDNCTNVDSIHIQAPLDFKRNGGITGASVELDTGVNKVYYIAYDECYNQTLDSLYITVVDTREPVVICDPVPAISLDNNGHATIQAYQIDGGSFDECGPVHLEIAKMDDQCGNMDEEFDHFVTFCCADIGFQMVILKATDGAGNEGICMMEVEIQNKYPPILTIPADTIVECTTNYDINNLSQFGNGQVFGACGGMLTDVGVASINQCGIGKIERTFTATSPSGTQTQQTQTIYFENSDPFDGDTDIDWPKDTLYYDSCLNIFNDEGEIFTTVDADVVIPPSLSGEPEVTKDACDLVGDNYEDEVLYVNSNLRACFKIHRTWKVVDWCQQVDGQYLKWDSVQVIEVVDTIKPEITSIAPSIDTDTFFIKSCNDQMVELQASGTTNCDTLVIWEYEIRDELGDLESSGQVTQNVNSPAIAQAELQNGTYTIQWIIRDGCGNFDIQSGAFIVKNKKLPTPYGKSLIVNVQKIGMDTLAEIWVSDVDNGSYHECDYPIDLSFSDLDTTLNSLTFGCEHVGITNFVKLWVTDSLGNQNHIDVEIVVNDTDGLCAMMRVAVTGEVYSTSDVMFEGVEIDLLGSDVPMTTTDDTGHYAFEDMFRGGQYTVKPNSMDNDPLNGVSTLDIVMIQRHVLGTSPLTDPYQLIAADINNSGNVSAVDLIELRKMILGVYSEFPNNDSWRFMDANFVFAVPDDPWLYELPDHYYINNLETNMFIPFVGIKTGDINSSVVFDVHSNEVEARSKTDLTLIISQTSETTNSKTYGFSLNELIDITGFQMELDYLNAQGNITQVSKGQAWLNDSNYNMNQNDQSLSLSWVGDTDFQNDQSPLFYVTVDKDFDINQIRLVQDRIMPELYEGLEVKSIGIDLRSGSTNDVVVELYPNPWANETQMSFELLESSEVKLVITDVSGKVVWIQEGDYTKGQHKITITAEDLRSPGVYNCSLQFGNQVVKKRMINIR